MESVLIGLASFLVGLILVAIIVFQGVMEVQRRRHEFKVQSQLLDRLMARDFPQYVQGTVSQETRKQIDAYGYGDEFKHDLRDPEVLAEWQRIQEQEEGIPVT